MDILVIGATGGSGRAVCDALLYRGHRVTALARHASTLTARAGLNPIDGDATDVDLLDRVMPGHGAVVVLVGPQVAVVVLGAKSNAGRFWETRHLFNWLSTKAQDLLGGATPAEPVAVTN